MKFGHFDDAKREYVITTPKTPLPWINYLGSRDFFSLISNTAGGYSFYKDAKLLRITRYRYNNCPLDQGGRYYYIKDGDSIWNPGWQPTQTPLDAYECRHGLGYTVITGKKNQLEAKLEAFVPVSDACEVNRSPCEMTALQKKALTSSASSNSVSGMPRTIRRTSSGITLPARSRWSAARSIIKPSTGSAEIIMPFFP